jgi:integrase
MQHLTTDEIKQVIRNIKQERNKLLIRVGFLHGLRISEILDLTKESIRDGYINVQRLKGSLPTIQPWVKHPDKELSEYEGLAAIYGTLKTREKLFKMTRNGAYKLIQRAGVKAGIAKHKLHPHALKHSCAMETINKSGIQNVRQWLGHKSISSTGEYLKVSDEVAAKEIMKSFSAPDKPLYMLHSVRKFRKEPPDLQLV